MALDRKSQLLFSLLILLAWDVELKAGDWQSF